MSVVNPPIKKNTDPPRNTIQPPNDGIGKYLDEVTGVVAPVWPLQDYVAVNPYAGISHRSFFEARAFLRTFSDCELLMPLEFYAKEFQKGRYSLEDIQTAIDEYPDVQKHLCLSASQIAENIQALACVNIPQAHPTVSSKLDHPIRTIAQLATRPKSVDWTEAVTDEISKHCAAHYDQGQAFWRIRIKLFRSMTDGEKLRSMISISKFSASKDFASTCRTCQPIQRLPSSRCYVNSVFRLRFGLASSFAKPIPFLAGALGQNINHTGLIPRELKARSDGTSRNTACL